MNDQSRAIWGTNHSTKALCVMCGRKWVYYVKGKFHFSKRCWGFMIFSVVNWESDIKIAWVCAAKCRTEGQSPLVKADIPRQGMQEMEGQFLLWSCRDPTPEPWLWSQPCMSILWWFPQPAIPKKGSRKTRVGPIVLLVCFISWVMAAVVSLSPCVTVVRYWVMFPSTEPCSWTPTRGMGTKTGQEEA